MNDKKDWSYFEFEVGRYEPFIFANEEEKKAFIPYKPDNKTLEWYVFYHDWNSNEICPTNVLIHSSKFVDGLFKAKRKYKNDYIKFAEEIRMSLQYAYWSKSEHETIITSWPPHIDEEEFNRLVKAKEDDESKGFKRFYENVNLTCDYKIDIYMQVMLNWNRFIDYLWCNKRKITKKGLGINDDLYYR